MMCLSVVQLLDNWFAFCILDSLALTIGVFFSTCISAWMKERSPLSRWTWSLPPMRIQTRWEFELFSFESSCQPIQASLTRFMSGTAQLNSCDHFFHIWKPSSWSLCAYASFGPSCLIAAGREQHLGRSLTIRFIRSCFQFLICIDVFVLFGDTCCCFQATGIC